jgi:hypothetical protein
MAVGDESYTSGRSGALATSLTTVAGLHFFQGFYQMRIESADAKGCP